jgi:hypothetical protein
MPSEALRAPEGIFRMKKTPPRDIFPAAALGAGRKRQELPTDSADGQSTATITLEALITA